jgi:soluble lytic murein transglycosylase
MHRSLQILGLVVCALIGSSARADEAPDALRARFAAALMQARTASTTALAPDDASFESYALYSYLEAARIVRALELGASDADARAAAFLSQHGDEPVARQLRSAWLEALARKRDWVRYVEFYVPGSGDAATTCRWVHAQILRGADDALTASAVEAWLTPRSAPDECDPVFEWMRGRGLLDADLIEQRARMALEAGEPRLASWLARSLPEERAAPIRWWAAALGRPAAAVDQVIAHPQERVDGKALEAAWTRLARRAPDAAIERFERLAKARAFDPGARSRYAQALALALSWSRRPEAIEFFAEIASTDYDELTHEWYARAALWAEDWQRAARVVAAMPDALREQPRWSYWAARAAEQLDESDRARAGYESVLPTDNYYALQSAARLSRRYTPQLVTLPLAGERIDALEQIPAFVRARELFAIEEPTLANREWNFAYRELADADRLQAVGLAARWGWHFQSIATAAGLREFNDYPLLYPRPYDAEVAAAARRTRLPESLIYGVIRQESLYQPYAVSTAGALGLMQLLPTTAARTARAINERVPRGEELKLPGPNVTLGAATLRELVDQFGGQTPLGLAGYNAGPNAARRWLPGRPVDADVWIENIPYNETRSYVQRVLWHSVVFDWLREGEPQDVSDLLARIETTRTQVATVAAGHRR